MSKQPTADIRVARTDAELTACIDVRRSVFIKEQGVPEHRELDGLDGEATHLLACGSSPVGTARLRPHDPTVMKVERVAVIQSHRDQGLGRELMMYAESIANKKGYECIRLDAQTQVIGFYERLDYDVVSTEFEDAGISHRTMEKQL
jgi:predicted GNAT family N-acyltransferase